MSQKFCDKESHALEAWILALTLYCDFDYHLTPGLTGRSFDGWQMDRVQVVGAGIWMRIEHLNTKRIFGVQLGVQI